MSNQSWDSCMGEDTALGKGRCRPAATAREDSKQGHCSELVGQGHLLAGMSIQNPQLCPELPTEGTGKF